jgi:hypothetical protein
MSVYRVSLAVAAALFASMFLAATVRATDFRLENAVFADGQSQPQSQGVTIFHEGLVFDFLNDPAEIIVFDKAHRRFILLDVGRRLRSEISIDDVKTFVARAKHSLRGHANPSVKWLADPSFEESFDRETAELTLKSTPITYRVQLQAAAADVAIQYHEFSDCYAQLNHVLSPAKSWPPFPRMMLNDAIERHQGVAKEVHLTAVLNPRDVPTKIASRHQLSVQLDAGDMKRLAQTREYMAKFRMVSLREYAQGR